MKLTAKLALSQIKISRSRAVWTLVGIILSTALITFVCNFAAVFFAMITDIYGENSYGNYAAMAAVPAGILCMIIVSMTIVVISNAFRVSAGERMAQFGMLKSVGATKRQIAVSVMYESAFFSAAGIPAGILAGLLLTFAGVRVANYFLEEINSLVHIMMTKIIFVIKFTVSWQALAAALISFFTVLFSAWIPARKAAKTAAIDSIRRTQEIKSEVKWAPANRFIEKLFGFEGTLALKNVRRNKRNFRSSVISLTVGIVMFINLSALSWQISLIENMIYPPDIEAGIMVDYTSAMQRGVNEVTGRNESVIAAAPDNEAAEEVTEKLRGYGNGDVDVFCFGENKETYAAIVPDDMISLRMAEALFSNTNIQLNS